MKAAVRFVDYPEYYGDWDSGKIGSYCNKIVKCCEHHKQNSTHILQVFDFELYIFWVMQI